MSDQHIVYAVLDTVGNPRIPVSVPQAWGAAIDRWAALDNERVAGNAPTVGLPRDRYPDAPVRFFAVRSTDDPGWPASDASYPRTRGLTRAALGRFV